MTKSTGVFAALAAVLTQVLAVEPPAGGRVAGPGGLRQRAIVFGINAYAGGPDGWPELRQASPDAARVADALEQGFGFTVERVFDAQATRQNMLRKIDGCARAEPDESILLYFAGHGHWDARRNEGYWIPVDAAKTTGGAPATQDWIWNSQVIQVLDVSPARHILVVADSCFSGAMFRGGAAAEERPPYEEWLAGTSRYLIASGDLEPVADNSGFAAALLTRLRDPVARVFSAGELGEAVRRDYHQVSRRQILHGPLPMRNVENSGQMVFVRAGSRLRDAGPHGLSMPGTGDTPAPPPPLALKPGVGRPDVDPSAMALRSAADLSRAGFVEAARDQLDGVKRHGQAPPVLLELLDRRLGQQAAASAGPDLSTITRNLAAQADPAAREKWRDHAKPRVVLVTEPVAHPAGDPVRAAEASMYASFLLEFLREDPGLWVVEREHLGEMLQEIGLGQSGLANSAAALQVGKLLPASLLVTSDYFATPVGTNFAVKVVDTASGITMGAVRLAPERPSVLWEKMREHAEKVARDMQSQKPWRARVLSRERDRLQAGIGSFHRLRQGQVLNVVRRRATPDGARGDFLETGVGKARAVAVGEMVSEFALEPPAGPEGEGDLWLVEPAPGGEDPR